jgi:hypothetical protein
MPSDSASLSNRAAILIDQLSNAATDLNKASDALGKSISAIDKVLKGLNLGVATWVEIASDESTPNGSSYWGRELGYAKIGNKWGISVRTKEGSYNDPDGESIDSWLFNDAPRWLRIEATEKLTDLLAALIDTAESTSRKIQMKTEEANQIATAVEQASRKKNTRTLSPTPDSVIEATKIAACPSPMEIIGRNARQTLEETVAHFRADGIPMKKDPTESKK